MGIKKLKFDNIFLILFLVIFPFGQIIRIGIFQPIDILAGLSALYSIFFKIEKPRVFKYFENFLILAGFSWIFGAVYFRQREVLYGLLYLLRLAAYFYFLIYAWNFAKKGALSKKFLTDSLLAVSVFSAIFGWVQYFLFPSIKAFAVWGWDDHLFRLVGTFLDPTFLGIIIVFGLLTTIYRYIVVRSGRMLLLTIFLIISLAFTYSRASYLAFFAGLLVMFFIVKKIRYFLLILGFFLALILILPTSKNHILSFTRQFSAVARIENYKETLNIFKTSPVFGVGYDNLCVAKANSGGFVNFDSHACSGSDSSLLFILTTTGIAGLIAFVYLMVNIIKDVKKNSETFLLISVSLSLAIHSLFSNSLVYPWVLGYLTIYLACNLGREV